MPDGPDLDALRDRSERCMVSGLYVKVTPADMLAVLSLVDDQQKENERLREAIREERKFHLDHCFCALCRLPKDALAGSPAANEEQQT